MRFAFMCKIYSYKGGGGGQEEGRSVSEFGAFFIFLLRKHFINITRPITK
jgi:hypothetical protein